MPNSISYSENSEKRGRRVEPMAAQQLVSVLGGKTGELAAMRAIVFHFDDNPMGLDCVNQYLTANPQVTGFAVADKAVEGKTAEAIVMMRSCGTRDRSHRVDRRVGHEAPYHCQSLGGPGRHDFTGRSEKPIRGC